MEAMLLLTVIYIAFIGLGLPDSMFGTAWPAIYQEWGPLFPNFNYLPPIIFGEEASPSIIGVQMAVSSLTTMTAPIICGFLGQQVGMWTLPFYLLIFFIGMIMTGFRANKVFWA